MISALRLLAAAVICTGFAGPLGAQTPSYTEMRAYRVSKLSDEQIRELHRRAPLEFEESRRLEAEAERKEAERQSEKARLCADIVYRERNPTDCRMGLITEPVRRHRYSSVQDAYEKLLMGLCVLAQTRAEAIQYGCLPPK